MKILLSSTNESYSNGAGKCLVDIATSLEKKGENVIVTLPRHGSLENILKKKKIRYVILREYREWIIGNQKLRGLKLRHFLNQFSIFKAIWLIKKEKIDIVHVNAITSPIAAIAAEKTKCKLVWHIREFLEDDLHSHFRNAEYAHNIINKADCMIAISKTIKKKWSQELTAPIKVIYDGLPIDEYLVKHKIKHNGVNIILYGRISEGKGQFFFVKGIHNFLKRNPSIKLNCYLAGTVNDENYFEKVMAYIHKYHLEENITYLGEIKNVKNMLSKMDISCVCSQREAFGRVTVESVLGGCLVVGAKSGATTELLTDGLDGQLYEYGSVEDFSKQLGIAIKDLNVFKQNMKKSQNKMATEYSLHKNIQSIIEVYKKLTNRT